MNGPGWRERLYRCKFGIGSGDRAGTFSIVLELPEYVGPYINSRADEQRRAAIQGAARAAVLPMFADNPRLIVLEMTPVATRVRPTWDR